MNIRLVIRLFVAILLGLIGWQLGYSAAAALDPLFRWAWIVGLSGVFIGALLGLLFAPYLTIVPFNAVRKWIASVAVSDLVAAGVGLILGLVISALVTFPLRALPGFLGNLMPLLAAIAITYVCIMVVVMRHREIAEYVTERKFLTGAPRKGFVAGNRYILDTSSIVDGRIADIVSTGFLTGDLIVPQFILRELQAIADSQDSLKRARGRRGLDVLAALQESSNVRVEIFEVHIEAGEDVDSKLLYLAKDLSAPIITNDYNLNKIATLQGVKILNVNELAHALRPVLLPGEDLTVKIIQEGKEYNQGVGYLDDGTMVVVEGGKSKMNCEVDVVVTRVLQTVAGRMVFAQLADVERDAR